MHQFRIYGKAYGISRAGGMWFDNDPYQVILADFTLRPREHFVYEYDMGDFWQHDIRIERVLPFDLGKTYPVCTGGAGDCPPEDCGGPSGYRNRLAQRCSWEEIERAREDLLVVAQRLLAFSQGGSRPTEDESEFRDALQRMHDRLEAAPSAFSRCAVNAALRTLRKAAPCTSVSNQLVAVSDDGTERLQEVAEVSRSEPTLETLGLMLDESKHILQYLQPIIIKHQVGAYLDQHRPCPDCGKHRHLKQSDDAPFRTLFGLVSVPNPRWEQCTCQPHLTKTVRPLTTLLSDRTSPELRYLETKWASLASYGATTKLLQDVLPIDHKHSEVTVRNHTLQAARRSEQALGAEQAMFVDGCQADRDRLQIPDGPLSVGIDGGIVRARRGTTGTKTANLFEVIAGKSILSFHRDDPEDVLPSSKCFALVQSVDTKPKRRLFDLLSSQGMQANQQLTFFSDGGENVRKLPEYLNPEAEHILDWFHLTMRLTVLQQCALGLRSPNGSTTVSATTHEECLERQLESVKHYLWHGNSASALDRLGDVEDELEGWGYDEHGEENPQPVNDAAARMLKYARELRIYITNNVRSIVNYGERYRNSEQISTGFVESTINQVVSKRMVKKQQMQWTPEGADLLLHVRTQVINDDWEATFRRWYPGFRPMATSATSLQQVAA